VQTNVKSSLAKLYCHIYTSNAVNNLSAVSKATATKTCTRRNAVWAEVSYTVVAVSAASLLRDTTLPREAPAVTWSVITWPAAHPNDAQRWIGHGDAWTWNTRHCYGRWMCEITELSQWQASVAF